MITAAACSPQAMTGAVKRTEKEARGKIGVSAKVVETRQGFSFHGTRHFPMQSVYKLPIAMAVLQSVEDGKLKLELVVQVREEDLIPPAGGSPLRDKHPKGGEFTLEDLLRRAIVESDGTASDVLLRVMGGTRQVRRYLKEAGIRGIHVEHTEAQLIDDNHAQYVDHAEPDGMVDLLARLQEGKFLNAEHRKLLLGWMEETRTGKDRIRAGLPPETVVADKTGSSGMTQGNAPATNDVGLITMPNGQHIAIAIFLSDAKVGTAARNAAIAHVAHEIWECWSAPAEAGRP